jgi:uncharacterized protein (TIGR00251 family)
MAVKIWLTVKPNTRGNELRKVGDDYVASVKAPAREGKANEALIKLLAAHFSVPNSSVRILRGQKSRRKLIEVG